METIKTNLTTLTKIASIAFHTVNPNGTLNSHIIPINDVIDINEQPDGSFDIEWVMGKEAYQETITEFNISYKQPELYTEYEKWNQGRLNNLGSFEGALMILYQKADIGNRQLMNDVWPERFVNRSSK